MVVFINMCDAANVEVIETRELLEEMGFSEGKLKVEMIAYNKTAKGKVTGIEMFYKILGWRSLKRSSPLVRAVPAPQPVGETLLW